MVRKTCKLLCQNITAENKCTPKNTNPHIQYPGKDVLSMALVQAKFFSEDDYYNLPEGVRAELIDGQLIYNQAAPSTTHQIILSELHTAINNYVKSKGGSCRVFPAPFAVKLHKSRETIVEPDISVICDRSKLTDKGCVGAPDWIIEIISPGNPGHDYIRKLNLYADASVREYWIVDPRIEKVFVYHLEQTDLQIETYTFCDSIKVNIYDDLLINFSAIADLLDIYPDGR